MYFLLANIDLILALAGLAMLAANIALYTDFFLFRGNYFSQLLERFSWQLIMLLTIGSVVMSLFYSEYLGFVPCSLCWLQRIAFYPQSLMSVLAYRARDYRHFPIYGIGISIFGLCVAGYQYVYQFLPKETLEAGGAPCLLDGSNADCAAKVIDEFGFVTFPFIAAVTFALLIIIYLYMLKAHKQQR